MMANNNEKKTEEIVKVNEFYANTFSRSYEAVLIDGTELIEIDGDSK
jgi:hypothetical protein